MESTRTTTRDLLTNTESDANSDNPRIKLERTYSPQSVMWDPDNGDCDVTPRPIQRVHFQRTVAVRVIRSHREFTPKQLRKCWYQADEFRTIRKACLLDLQKKADADRDQESSEIEDETFCIRGLDNFEETTVRQKRWMRAEAAMAVFDAIDYGFPDIVVASEYATVAKPAQRWARFVGLRDQRYAESIYDGE